MEGDTGESASSSINAATKKGIIQKVLARAGSSVGKSTLLISPVKPGHIIKLEGQSIVGKSNNNATGGQTDARTVGDSTTAADGDDNGFKITPDYIQESEYHAIGAVLTSEP